MSKDYIEHETKFIQRNLLNKILEKWEKLEKSGNFVGPKKWQPWL